MASFAPSNGLNRFFFFFFIFVSLLMSPVQSALEFHVGGSKGWKVPAADDTESYNHWAMRSRFHVGDYVYFKYVNDSVLLVDRKAYSECNTTAPLLEFADGNTTFRFDRYGFFYFISGTAGHCEAGQRIIIRVMVHPEVAVGSPGPAPGLQPGGSGGSGQGSWEGPSGHQESSGASLAVAGYSTAIMAVLGGVLSVVFFY
ncbi:early nodulin-like protein 21 [Typha angustifolia]|uniref:early nodulin-like protein 21 n=1 Tax=Typha angustifolia TaxID=59011 RepID=UPI003C2D9A42